jgi:hypothetical protein
MTSFYLQIVFAESENANARICICLASNLFVHADAKKDTQKCLCLLIMHVWSLYSGLGKVRLQLRSAPAIVFSPPLPPPPPPLPPPPLLPPHPSPPPRLLVLPLPLPRYD